MNPSDPDAGRTHDPKLHPFRRAVLRGMALILPPLLTIVIFLWVGNSVQEYIITPVKTCFRYAIVFAIEDIRAQQPPKSEGDFKITGNDEWIPADIYEEVRTNQGLDGAPLETGKRAYHRYAEIHYLPSYLVIIVVLGLMLMVSYLLGKFMAAGIVRMLWTTFDRIIHRLPLIRNVYGSVKQVTDFVFSEREIAYTRVVAVEYPRKGIWSIGFVTSEGMLDIRTAVNEPILTVLMPTSPMPATGFTVTVRKSETIDLDITVDQALQFVVSCGVVVPPHQVYSNASESLAASLSSSATANGGGELTVGSDSANQGGVAVKEATETEAGGETEE